MQSRYYDARTCRFINGDKENNIGALKTAVSYNSYFYCQNNPTNMEDSDGMLPKWIKRLLNEVKGLMYYEMFNLI